MFGFQKGLFTQAHGGSFFFDEISEMPLAMQAKLLRILEEKSFYPLGGTRIVQVDVRIIAASNRLLENRVKEGAFREDLFYRIHVIPIRLPPLRERKEDILPLARHFLERFAEETGKPVKDFTAEAVRKLLAGSWPGNVRELENAVAYAVAMADGERITDSLIPTESTASETVPQLKDAKVEFEKNYIVELMEMTSGNVSQAAKMAGKYRADFYALLRKHGIDPERFR